MTQSVRLSASSLHILFCRKAFRLTAAGILLAGAVWSAPWAAAGDVADGSGRTPSGWQPKWGHAEESTPSSSVEKTTYVQEQAPSGCQRDCEGSQSQAEDNSPRQASHAEPATTGNSTVAGFYESVRLSSADGLESIGQGEIVYSNETQGPDIGYGCADCGGGDCGSGGCGSVGGGCGVGECWDDAACWGPGSSWGPGDCYGGRCYPCFPPVRDHLWVRGEYLLWWTKGFRVPALVTTSNSDVAFSAGALGEGTLLFGNERLNAGDRSGGRIQFGYWLDACQTVGIETTYFSLDSESTRYFNQSTNGVPTLARPYYSVADGIQRAWPVALSGETEAQRQVRLNGTIAVEATTTDLHGIDILLRRGLSRQCNRRIDFLIGYRFARLNDLLTISQTSTAFDPGNTLDVVDQLTDRFGTSNEFNGAEIGIAAQMRHCRWSLEGLAKLALGSTRHRVDISGTSVTEGDAPESTGLLALDTNIGSYSQQEFSVIPEFGATVGYDLTCRLRATVGYTFLYWSRVARPGDQIDLDLDLESSGGLPDVPPESDGTSRRPAVDFVVDDFWAQGLNFGLDYRF